MSNTTRLALASRPAEPVGVPTPANEAQAKRELHRAIVDFGHHSPAADGALRHLLLIRRFNELYAWPAN